MGPSRHRRDWAEALMNASMAYLRVGSARELQQSERLTIRLTSIIIARVLSKKRPGYFYHGPQNQGNNDGFADSRTSVLSAVNGSASP